MSKLIDLTGQRFGRLVVMRRTGTAKNRNAKWLCQCDCGNQTVVDGYRLRNGMTRSCGCLRREKSKITVTKNEAFQRNKGKKTSLIDNDGIFYASKIKSQRNRTGVVGVSYDKRSGKYFARLRWHGRYVLIKSFDNLEEAVSSRKKAEEKYWRHNGVDYD
ncbi:AP2 domain-containing protein [Pediococcus siamensis]|uniref:AP2 domain-containing protein n=1 Tax=Pediococcus siamensis TaxID=381829 RepID=UPI0039A39F15